MVRKEMWYTEVTLHQEFHSNPAHDNAVLLIREYGECYVALFDDAKVLLDCIEKEHLEPERFSDQSSEYGRPRIGFGCHYLSKVCAALYNQHIRIALDDLPERNKAHRAEMDEVDRKWREQQELKEKRKQKPVQLEIQFEW